jgi:hypothetical protein
MKDDYTHISVILDRTGSMQTIRDDTIGGFNAFLEDQKKQPGQATLTLVQFDSEDPYEVIHDFKPIADIPPLTRETFVPRASTPLLDAMGRGINDLEKRIADLPEQNGRRKSLWRWSPTVRRTRATSFDTKTSSAWSRNEPRKTAGSSSS